MSGGMLFVNTRSVSLSRYSTGSRLIGCAGAPAIIGETIFQVWPSFVERTTCGSEVGIASLVEDPALAVDADRRLPPVDPER